MLISEFDYELPQELIAQEPPAVRGTSRMLVLDPLTDYMEIMPFHEIRRFLVPGDAVVVNNTKVIRARIYAGKETGAKIEIFLLAMASAESERVWQCFMKGAKRVKPGTVLRLFHFDSSVSPFSAEVLAKNEDGTCVIRFSGEASVDAILKECGHLPLPPYIKRPDAPMDSERYQTIYAQTPGAVAAPTAGLHFTREDFAALAEQHVTKVELTLHVGAGTFKPVSEEKVEDHVMHKESFLFPESAAAALNQTRSAGRRILAVGTTSLRTLESCVKDDGSFVSGAGETGIYIYPPYKIKSADMLLTNFHLPKSTLLMLVSAFAGMEPIRRAYRLAVQERMRFFSYGDCMLILNRVR